MIKVLKVFDAAACVQGRRIISGRHDPMLRAQQGLFTFRNGKMRRAPAHGA